ncbi:MAG: RIP metalloprotease RseP [Ardenticatenales bacterium]
MQLPGWLITVFYFFAALYPLVLVHELGHFTMAKLNRIRVEEFGLGFPPRALRLFTAGGTDYTLNWLPLGGFVRLFGEDDPTEPGAFAAARPRARAAVLLAGPFSNFLLTILILSGIAAAWGVERADFVRIGKVSEGQPAAAAGVADGDIVLTVNGRPAGSFAPEGTMAGREAIDGMVAATGASADQPLQLTLLRGAGEPVTERAPAALQLGAPRADIAARPVIAGGAADGPLAANNLVYAPRDVALGQREPRAGESLMVLPVRSGATLEAVALTVTPRRDATSGDARMGVEIGPLAYPEKVPLWRAPVYGVNSTVGMLGTMITGLARMIGGTAKVEVAGPVGIARLSRQAGESGWMTLLQFAAILSANLGLINLFPIPGLDGGRLLFVGIEAVRGRRVEPRREAIVHALGIAFVLLLMLSITVFEVFHPLAIGQP